MQDGQYERPAVGTGAVVIAASLLVLALAFFLPVFFSLMHMQHMNRSDVRALRAQIPQAIEIFEQSREHFDVLVNGEFMGSGVAAVSSREIMEECWVLSIVGTVIPENLDMTTRDYWPWRLERLPDEEMVVLLFLLHSHELEDNFRVIRPRSTEMWFELYSHRYTRLTISYGEPDWTHRRNISLSQELGDGYILWIDSHMPQEYYPTYFGGRTMRQTARHRGVWVLIALVVFILFLIARIKRRGT